MIRGETRRLVAGALGLAALGVFVALRLQVNTDITYFLPGGEADPDVTLAKQLTGSELSRTMVLLVDAPALDEAVAAGRELQDALAAEPRVGPALAFLEGGPPPGLDEALWGLYHPRRLAFLTGDPADVPAVLTDEALRAAAGRLKQKLALPVSGLVSRVAPEDPLLILPDLFEHLPGARGEGLALVEGRFVTADGLAAALLLGTVAPPFDTRAQRPLLDGVRSAFDAVNARHGGRLALSQSGANRFSLRAEDAIRSDIGRVSSWSVVGILVLFLGLFRSLRIMLISLPVIAAGSLAGTAGCLALFGHVHGLTMAFGAALIGVSVDYSAHFYCHRMLAPGAGGPRATLATIWPALLLGAVTTVVGFIALVWSSFPGLREMAVFGAFGIAGAIVATHQIVPGLMPAVTRPTRASQRIVDGVESVLGVLGRSRALQAALLLSVVALGAAGLPRVRWNDDIADLNRLDPELVQEDARIRERVVRYEQRRFVVAVGRDEQEALAINTRVAGALAAGQRAGELAGFRSAATLLPGAESQRAVAAAVRSDPTLWTRLQAALAAEGFVTDAFLPFRDALAAPEPEPLVWQDLAASPLAPLVRPFRVTLDDGVGLLSFVVDVRDAGALEHRLAAVPGARLVDIKQILTDAYATYRSRMTSLLLLGMLAVIGLVAARHRALRPTVVACLPAVLAAAATVAVLSLCGVALNILSLVTLLMVVSMGDDFGIFLAETGEDRAARNATHLAVLLSGLSTILGFGLLALSDYPALDSIGLTAGVGVGLCMLFAPVIGVLFRAREAAPTKDTADG